MVDIQVHLNATLFIQAINFGIAYFLLRTFLLKPAIAVRSQEQTMQDAALQLISRRQQQIEHTMYAQHQLWRSCNNYYETGKPTMVDRDIFRDMSISVPVFEISAPEKQAAVIKAVSLIQKTIGERL